MIYAVVVVYNKACKDSQTIRSIEEFNSSDIRVILFDNSTKEYNNKHYAEKYNYTYYTLKKNVGLSKAYNYVIQNTKVDENDFFLILDDDTNLTKEYLDEAVRLSCSINENQIYFPVVVSNNIIISPCVLHMKAIPRLTNKVNLPSKKMTAINSGMLVRSDVYKKIKYNEEQFLDYVDHDFILQALKNNIKTELMQSKIYQNFSRFEKSPVDNVIARFKIYKKDLKVYCKKYNCGWFYYLSVCKFAILNCFKYKEVKIIKVLLE